VPCNLIHEACAFSHVACTHLLDLWVLNTTILADYDVSTLLQFSEHTFLVNIRNAALKLKHGAD
jgi:hypothetical protein